MFRKITFLAAFIAFIAILAGTYLRLSGIDHCSDWSSCLGQQSLSDKNYFELTHAYLTGSFEYTYHNYLAGILCVLILLLAVMACWQKQQRLLAVTMSSSIILLITLQTIIGMWSLKMHNLPIVTTVHLLFGLIIFWALFWLYLRVNFEDSTAPPLKKLMFLSRSSAFILLIQICLGVWVSTNFAATACHGFPQCNGQWLPTFDYQGAFDVFNGILNTYTKLTYENRVAIHIAHRLMAILCFLMLAWVSLEAVFVKQSTTIKSYGMVLFILLVTQFSLGILGAVASMPIWISLTHTGVASLLMLPLIAISLHTRLSNKAEIAKALATENIPSSDNVIPKRDAEKEIYVEPAPESLYLRLKSQLRHTRNNLGSVLNQIAIGKNAVNADLFEDIEANLLMADVGIEATTDIIRRLSNNLARQQQNDSNALTSALKQELLEMLRPCSKPLVIPKQDMPFVILVVGVNGAGKTTTIGKLAKRLQAQGHSVMLAAGDTFRAAAVEQLQTWGERNNIAVVAQHTGADSASVIFDAVQSAQAKKIDVLIADTAGRLHTKSNLMEELKKVKRIIGKLDETAPHEVLLVLDAGTGQNALSQAKLFNETVALSGLVLTKLDGTAKGGVIFALAKQMNLPIRYIGIGEGIDDLQDFNAENFVDALFFKD
ncbi:MAG: signal recognition particle-docking protein FtsY [Methylococcaceae bacterium]|jgi:fused signal recognition particle receptor